MPPCLQQLLTISGLVLDIGLLPALRSGPPPPTLPFLPRYPGGRGSSLRVTLVTLPHVADGRDHLLVLGGGPCPPPSPCCALACEASLRHLLSLQTLCLSRDTRYLVLGALVTSVIHTHSQLSFEVSLVVKHLGDGGMWAEGLSVPARRWGGTSPVRSIQPRGYSQGLLGSFYS